MLNSDLFPSITIGLDLGDRKSRTCEVDATGRVVRRASVATTVVGLQQYFGGRERCRVALEVGTHSPWVSRVLEELGHETIVGNPAEIYGKRRRSKRNDDRDAEFLARQGRADPELLHPIQHRSAQAQEDLALLRSRDQLVRVRTKLICHVRGAVKSTGKRIGRCSAECFGARAMFEIPPELRTALKPLVETIEELTRKIGLMDRQVARAAGKYPVVKRLQAPAGVGPITALGYVLLVEDPRRFRKSRQVGAYFGLVPKLDESSDSSPQLRITKSGDELGRRLLVSAAHYILGPHGPDCDLRRHGEAMAARGGKNAKKRAVVAVARKLAVMLHRLWVSETLYDPDFVVKHRAA
jgi:transposase